MRQYYYAAAVLVSTVLAGCGGGGGSSDIPAKPKFTSQVTFGDSLSDVGSYNVGMVNAANGGQFTINIPSALTGKYTATNWTEMIAPQLGLSAVPCAAQTGLDDGVTPASTGSTATTVTVVNHPECTGYAQGGARVTNPAGVGNKAWNATALKSSFGGFALTVPIKIQIDNHIAAHGNFSGNEIVFVMAGANDLFVQLGTLQAGAIQAQVTYDVTNGLCTPADAQASNCVAAAQAALAAGTAAQALAYLAANSAATVTAMGTAATELSGYVNDLVQTKGAKHVVVMSIPDINATPRGATFDANTKGLVSQMISTFNTTLKNGVSSNASVLYVDAFSANHDEVANPSKYLLTNVTDTACNLTTPSPNALGSSLVCNPLNLNTGVLPTAHYLFADSVHPTPYGHALFSMYVLQAMTNKGWY